MLSSFLKLLFRPLKILGLSCSSAFSFLFNLFFVGGLLRLASAAFYYAELVFVAYAGVCMAGMCVGGERRDLGNRKCLYSTGNKSCEQCYFTQWMIWEMICESSEECKAGGVLCW